MTGKFRRVLTDFHIDELSNQDILDDLSEKYKKHEFLDLSNDINKNYLRNLRREFSQEEAEIILRWHVYKWTMKSIASFYRVTSVKVRRLIKDFNKEVWRRNNFIKKINLTERRI